jgi:preprotein translocase subunit SecG
MTGVLLISQIVLVVIITIAVLLQKSSSIGLGAYSGSNESVFGAKGPGSFLAKMTFFFGFLFIVNTITLGYFYAQESSSSVVDTVVETTDVAAPAQQLPAEPEQAVTTESNTSK